MYEQLKTYIENQYLTLSHKGRIGMPPYSHRALPAYVHANNPPSMYSPRKQDMCRSWTNAE